MEILKKEVLDKKKPVRRFKNNLAGNPILLYLKSQIKPLFSQFEFVYQMGSITIFLHDE